MLNPSKLVQMKSNLSLLFVTLGVALGLSNFVIPNMSLEVIPGLVVSECALLWSTGVGLLLDLAGVWLGELLRLST